MQKKSKLHHQYHSVGKKNIMNEIALNSQRSLNLKKMMRESTELLLKNESQDAGQSLTTAAKSKLD